MPPRTHDEHDEIDLCWGYNVDRPVIYLFDSTNVTMLVELDLDQAEKLHAALGHCIDACRTAHKGAV